MVKLDVRTVKGILGRKARIGVRPSRAPLKRPATAAIASVRRARDVVRSPSQALSSCNKEVPSLGSRQLRLVYFALRHGESEANVEKVIVSDPKRGKHQYGLTSVGSEAIKLCARDFASRFSNLKTGVGIGSSPSGTKLRRVLLCSSDFLRTSQTASVFARTAAKGLPPGTLLSKIRFDVGLRERRFGEFEGFPNTNYQLVWDVDEKDPKAEPYGAESAVAVRRRTEAVVQRLESDCMLADGTIVILVSHGDALQILQTSFQRHADPAKHRSVEHLQPGELRLLGQSFIC